MDIRDSVMVEVEMKRGDEMTLSAMEVGRGSEGAKDGSWCVRV